MPCNVADEIAASATPICGFITFIIDEEVLDISFFM